MKRPTNDTAIDLCLPRGCNAVQGKNPVTLSFPPQIVPDYGRTFRQVVAITSLFSFSRILSLLKHFAAYKRILVILQSCPRSSIILPHINYPFSLLAATLQRILCRILEASWPG